MPILPSPIPRTEVLIKINDKIKFNVRVSCWADEVETGMDSCVVEVDQVALDF